jgi:IS5 family transposase
LPRGRPVIAGDTVEEFWALNDATEEAGGDGEGDLFRARLDQIINLKHELVQLGAKIDWDWIDREIAPLYSAKGRPEIESRFVIGLLLLKHIYGLSDEDVCERWVYAPYFQHFTGEEFFQHEFPHERSDLSHWRKRLGSKLELLLAESLLPTAAIAGDRSDDILRRIPTALKVAPKKAFLMFGINDFAIFQTVDAVFPN